MENRNFINGSFINSISNKSVKVTNPANQALVGSINEAMDDEIENEAKIFFTFFFCSFGQEITKSLPCFCLSANGIVLVGTTTSY